MNYRDSKPYLKVHTILDENEIAGLPVVSQERFEEIIDMLYLLPSPDYKHIPNIIRLPPLQSSLAELDKSDATKTNKIIFNSDTLGNYVVTISKIETSKLQMKNYVKVGAGVAPAIRRS